MFQSYQILKDFHFGAIRSEVKAGGLLEFDGQNVRISGTVYPVTGFDLLLHAGLVASLNGPQLPTARTPVPLVEKAPKAAVLPDKPHQWDSGLFGNGEKTCTVCGVTMANPQSTNVSAASLEYTYTDAYGVQISSLKELPCPLFVGNLGGGIASNTHRARKLTGKVESIDDRVAHLESENSRLHVEAARRQEAAILLLERLTAATERLVVLGDGEATKLLPDHGDILDAILIEPPEKVLIRATPMEGQDER